MSSRVEVERAFRSGSAASPPFATFLFASSPARRRRSSALPAPGRRRLLRCLAGLLAHDAGEILFDDAPVGSLPAERRGVGFVFQSYALFPHMTVRENLAFGLDVRRSPSRERDGRIRELAVSLGSRAAARPPARGDLRRRTAASRFGKGNRLSPGSLAARRASGRARSQSRVVGPRGPARRDSKRGDHGSSGHARPRGCAASRRSRDSHERRPDRAGGLSLGALSSAGQSVRGNVLRSGNDLAAAGGSQRPRTRGPDAAGASRRFREREAGPVTLLVRPEAIRPADSGGGRRVSVEEAHYEGDRYRLRVSYEGGETTLEWPPDREVQRGDCLRVRLEPSLVVVCPAAGCRDRSASPRPVMFGLFSAS